MEHTLIESCIKTNLSHFVHSYSCDLWVGCRPMCHASVNNACIPMTCMSPAWTLHSTRETVG